MNYFSKFDIKTEDLKKLENYESRVGFNIIEKSEFQDMLEYFEQYEVYNNLIPILTDNNSNYWCLYYAGILKGMICYLNHGELSLEPKFKGISELLETIEKNPESYDFDELNIEVFDFPTKNDSIDLINRKEIVTELLTELELIEQEDRKQQIAFSIMNLTSESEIESIIYPFLDNQDMYIQERAIELLGIYKYKAARNKLIELTKTAMPNGKSAAGKALKELNKT